VLSLREIVESDRCEQRENDDADNEHGPAER